MLYYKRETGTICTVQSNGAPSVFQNWQDTLPKVMVVAAKNS